MSIMHFSMPVTPGIAVNLTNQSFATQIVNNNAALYLYMERAGNYHCEAINGGPSYPILNQWYIGSLVTPGDSVWVRLTLSTGDAPAGAAIGAWLPLSANRIWSWTATFADSVKQFTGVLAIAADAGGSTILDSATVSISATYIDLGIGNA